MPDQLFGTGKLPAPFLQRMLQQFGQSGDGVVVHPAIGVDGAVLAPGDELLVAASDPVTFATERIGWYAVHINANDVACMGAAPRWFLATILLPPASRGSMVSSLFERIHDACSALGVGLVGGHTEMTAGLSRPLIVGTMLGTVRREHLVTPERARVGDAVLMVKPYPIEAAALIANERATELVAQGWTAAEIARAQNVLFDPGLSVVEAAQIAVRTGPVHAMHDPTEGGVAGGLRELAQATGLGILVDADSMPQLPLGVRLCLEYDLNPMGAIASGSLLAVVPPDAVAALLSAYEGAGIRAAEIGRLTAPGSGEWLVSGDERMPLPTFPVDEITKLYG